MLTFKTLIRKRKENRGYGFHILINTFHDGKFENAATRRYVYHDYDHMIDAKDECGILLPHDVEELWKAIQEIQRRISADK